MLLFTLSEFTTSTYRLLAAHFCVRVQESLSDISSPHKPTPNYPPLLSLPFKLSFTYSTPSKLIANSVAFSLLVTRLMKPLLSLP